MCFNPLLISGIEVKSLGYNPILGPGSIIYIVFIVFTSIFSFIILLSKYKSSREIERYQIKYTFFGLSLCIFFALLLSGIIPLVTRSSDTTQFAPFSTTFFLAFTTYAIVKYRLMDIRIFLRRAFVIGGALTSSLIISLGIFYLNSKVFNAIIPDVVILPIALFTGIILFFLFQKWFLKFANKFFFTTLYDRQQVTEELAAKMNQTLDLNELLTIISSKLTQVFGVEQYVFASCDNSQKNACYIEQNSVINIKSVHKILNESHILNYLEKTTNIIVRDEILPFIEEEALKPKKTDEHIRKALLKLKENLSDAEIAVCVPIVSNNKLISLLLLGDKLSKDAYTVEDIRLLETVSDQAAVAIQNARLYKASQEFN
ncbi:MAG: hypothetical protein ACD_26C00061G0001, partial [uncultured bacterium]